ncbi:MAG: DUF4127 family protein [Firmicutes bacterium]|nr:DUF4127 family protein [Bacillota bacterium]
MKRIIIAVAIFFVAVTACAGSPVEKEDSINIMYVPLDQRPVNLNYVTGTVDAAADNVITPPLELLPHKRNPGEIGKLWQWVFENGKQADYIVLSADTMVYGGLTPSRIHNISEDVLTERLANFDKIKELNPDAKLFVFDTIMRTHKQNTSLAEPDYYGIYGSKIFEITALWDKGEVQDLTSVEEKHLRKLLDSVPQEVLKDYMDRREKNSTVNSKLVEKTYDGVIDHLVLCRDDTSSYSQSSREYRVLAEMARDLPRNKFTAIAGADEVGLLLLTRAVNEMNNQKPAVYTRYANGVGGMTIPRYEDYEVWKSVRDHINAAGCLPAYTPKEADLILAVNTPENGVTGEAGSVKNMVKDSEVINAFVNDIGVYIGRGHRLAVADIAFNNGSDNSLMAELASANLLEKLTAYAGWNTAGNSLGYALGQGVLAGYMEEKEAQHILAVRLLDDWGYQANVRSDIQRNLVKEVDLTKFNIQDKEALMRAAVKAKLMQFADENLDQFNIEGIYVTFPWNRTFEIYLRLNEVSS